MLTRYSAVQSQQAMHVIIHFSSEQLCLLALRAVSVNCVCIVVAVDIIIGTSNDDSSWNIYVISKTKYIFLIEITQIQIRHPFEIVARPRTSNGDAGWEWNYTSNNSFYW